jgi:hypothetical protein
MKFVVDTATLRQVFLRVPRLPAVGLVVKGRLSRRYLDAYLTYLWHLFFHRCRQYVNFSFASNVFEGKRRKPKEEFVLYSFCPPQFLIIPLFHSQFYVAAISRAGPWRGPRGQAKFGASQLPGKIFPIYSSDVSAPLTVWRLGQLPVWLAS